MDLKRDVECDSGYFPDGLGSCQPCWVCQKLSRPPRGCEICDFPTTAARPIETTTHILPTTEITSGVSKSEEGPNRFFATTEIVRYRTAITGQSFLSCIQWTPLAVVGVAIVLMVMLVVWAARRKTSRLPANFNVSEDSAINHSPVQTRVEFNHLTGQSETCICRPQHSQPPHTPSDIRKNSIEDAKRKYSSTFYQEHYLNRHCQYCSRIGNDHSPHCSTQVTIKFDPCVRVHIDQYPFK